MDTLVLIDVTVTKEGILLKFNALLWQAFHTVVILHCFRGNALG